VRNAIRKGMGGSVVRQVKSKAADKWRRAHLEREDRCDRYKKNAEMDATDATQKGWRKSEEEWEVRTTKRKSGGMISVEKE
jgi:hypothetical protein